MSFFVWCELVCDGCAQTVAGQHTKAERVPRRAMKREAIDDFGWVFHANGDTHCRTCAPKYQDHE